jgi:DNA repair exonuclease SbcCD ATPase subunit
MAAKRGQNDDARPLIAAAEAFDDALQRFSSLTELLRRRELDSRHALESAAQLLKDVTLCQEELQAKAQALISALGVARDTQQSQADFIQARAHELQERTQAYAALTARFEEVGVQAAGLNTLAQGVASRRGIADQSLRETELPGLLAELDELRERMGSVAEQAARLIDDARTARFEELCGRADSLRQQLLAARNKVGLLRETLVKAVPPTLIS